MVDSDPLNIKLLLESWKPRHAWRCGVVPFILLRYHEPSFIVTGWAGVSIHRHLLTLHGGEVLAAHPRIKVENLKFLQTFGSAFRLQKCTIAYYVKYQVSKTFEWNNLLASTSSSFAIPGAKFPCCESAAHRGEWAQQSHLFPKHPNFQDLKKCKSKVGPKSLGLLFLEKGRRIGKPCPHNESSQPNSIWRNTHLFNMQGHYLNVKSSYDSSFKDLG